MFNQLHASAHEGCRPWLLLRDVAMFGDHVGLLTFNLTECRSWGLLDVVVEKRAAQHLDDPFWRVVHSHIPQQHHQGPDVLDACQRAAASHGIVNVQSHYGSWLASSICRLASWEWPR
jgi:hypothetical protein